MPRKGRNQRPKRDGGPVSGGKTIPAPSMAMRAPFGVLPRVRRVMAHGYTEAIVIPSASSTIRLWYCNSGYKIDGTTSVGGWNDMMDLYSKAYVLGGRITAKMIAVGGGSIFASSSVTTAIGTPASVQAAMTTGRSTYGIVSSYGSGLTLKTEWDVADVLTKSKVVDDPELFGTRASYPINQFYNYLILENPGPGSMTVMVQILGELTTEFVDPLPIT